MPRYTNTFGRTAQDEEIDALWRRLDATDAALRDMESAVSALQAAGAAAAAPSTSSSSAPNASAPAARVPPPTSSPAAPAAQGGWAQGGVVVSGETVVVYGPLTLEGQLIIYNGRLIIASAPTASNIANATASRLNVVVPGPE